MNLDRAMDYVHFVTERHAIWQRRQAGAPGPWTTDPILASKKFTNVFRILDHDSQWLVRNLLDGDPRDVLMRCFLFRHTGRVAAWETLTDGAPTVHDLDYVHAAFRAFGKPFFTNAYLVYPQSQTPGTDKVDSIMDLTRRLFTWGSPHDVVPDFLAARSQAERFSVLRRNPGVGDFVSYQVLLDWSYSEHGGDRENEFLVAGPGTRRGAALVEPGQRAEDTVRWAQQMLHQTPECPRLGSRLPTLADVANTFCEFLKYSRGPRLTNIYTPAHPGPQPAPVYPSHWRI